VTWLLRRLKAGSDSALRPLVQRFWPLIVRRAQQRLDPKVCRTCDGEDVAQQAVWELYRRVREGDWKQLDDRNDLVALLYRLTDCRAMNEVRHELTRIRGGGRVRNETALPGQDSSGGPLGIDQVAIDPTLPPDQAVAEQETWRRFFDRLDDGLRPFADMLLEDWPIARMASAMQCSERTVHRKVALVRGLWLRLLADEACPPTMA
jgi:DNA-directed RNA polymerase specialized sigma24 family protein